MRDSATPFTSRAAQSSAVPALPAATPVAPAGVLPVSQSGVLVPGGGDRPGASRCCEDFLKGLQNIGLVGAHVHH